MNDSQFYFKLYLNYQITERKLGLSPEALSVVVDKESLVNYFKDQVVIIYSNKRLRNIL